MPGVVGAGVAPPAAGQDDGERGRQEVPTVKVSDAWGETLPALSAAVAVKVKRPSPTGAVGWQEAALAWSEQVKDDVTVPVAQILTAERSSPRSRCRRRSAIPSVRRVRQHGSARRRLR